MNDANAATERTARIVQATLDSAERAIVDKEWEEALGYIEDVRVLDPDNAEVPVLMQLVERHTEGINAEQGRRFVTVLFADMVGSTHLGEQMELEPYAAFMRLFEGAGRPVVDRYGGHIHNFFGDGMIAYFGYPTAHGDDARRAVLASLDILDEVRAVAPRAKMLYEADLQVRIGVYSGEVVVADRGTGAWMERSAAFGPTMNRAARLQTVASPDCVVVSDSTLQLLGGEFEVRSLGTPAMKGIDEPIDAFEVLGRSEGASSGPALDGPEEFVGRSDSLLRIKEHWDKICRASTTVRARSVEIVGEPGIGKSRLIREFRAGLGGTPTTVIDLQCSSYGSHIPLWPVRSFMSNYVGLAEAESPEERAEKLSVIAIRAGRDVASTVPILANLLRTDIGSAYPPLELAPLQMREVVLMTVRDLVAGLAENRPTVVVVEDAHWADELTVELVRRMARIEGPAMVLSATRKPGVIDLPSSEKLTIRLDPLPRPQAAALASMLLPSDSPLETIVEVADRSDGIPLFIDQMARSISHENSGATTIPAGLKELLQARLDAVGAAVRTAQIASVIGRELDLDLLEKVERQLNGEELTAVIDVRGDIEDLLTAGLMEQQRGGKTYRFRHALVENKAYDAMLAPFRRQVHGAVAATLAVDMAADGDVDPGFVALHYELAGMATEAVYAYLEATRSAIDGGALGAAGAHLTTAMGLLSDVSDELRPALELGIRLNRGYVISSSQGYAAPEAVEDYRVALELCEQLADQPWIGGEVVKALFGTWTFHAACSDLDRCEAAEELLATQLETVEFPGGRPALESCRGVREFYLGDYRSSRTTLERAIAAFSVDDVNVDTWLLPNDPMVAAGAFLMLGRFFDGDEIGAFEIRDTVMARAADLPFPQSPFSIAFTSALEVWIHRARGDYGASLEVAERMVGLGDRHGFVDWQIVGQMNVPASHAMLEPTSELAGQMEAAIDLWRSLGAEVLVNSLLIELAGIYHRLGDGVSARRCLSSAFVLADRGQRVGLPDAHVVRARLAASEGDRTATVAHLWEAVELAGKQGAPFAAIRAGVAAADILGHDQVADFKDEVLAALAHFGENSEIPEVIRARQLF